MTSLEDYRRNARERQKRYYEKNKEKIRNQKKQIYHLGKHNLNNIENEINNVENVENEIKTREIGVQTDPVEIVNEKNDKETQTELLEDIEHINNDLTLEYIKEVLKKSSHYKNEFTRKIHIKNLSYIFRALEDNKLIDVLNDEKKLKQFIKNVQNLKQKNDKYYSLSNISRILGSLLTIIKVLNIKISEKNDKILFNAFRTAKLNYDLHQYKNKNELKKDNAVKSFNDVLRDVENKYGKKSLEYLLIKIFENAPLRGNDFNNMILVENENNLEENINYMILPKNGNAKILIQKYKTKKHHGDIHIILNQETTKLIRNYIKINKIKYNDKIFNSMNNIFINITNDKEDKEDGGARLLRRSIASTYYDDFLNGKKDINEIYEQIQKMGHSADTHMKSYIYSIK